jgi:GNAT superfamily N-acetyltransferase
MDDVAIRPFEVADAGPVTELLHRAYAELGAAGLNFTAVDQTIETTLYRASGGHCLVAWVGADPVATMTMSMPPSRTLRTMFPAADRDDIAWLNQLGVDPAKRGLGLARRLWRMGDEWAIEQDATTIGVDTAIPATHLVELYEAWGFTRAGTVHWEGKNYDSAVLLKDREGQAAARPATHR